MKNFSFQGYYGLFTLHLTPLSAENGRKTIEGMKIRLRAIEWSSKKKKSYKEETFFWRKFKISRLTDKPWQKVLSADLLWEKNTAEWLPDLADKLKRTSVYHANADKDLV